MPVINSPESLERCALKMGFLPFFSHEIQGFSIEEMTPREFWFSDDVEGPWEWKGPVISYGSVAYGKLFRGKAGYVSLDWYPDLLNYRRSLYHPNDDERKLYGILKENESLLTHDLKQLAGYVRTRRPRLNPLQKMLAEEEKNVVKTPRSRREGFETAITRLQMACFVVIADFEYRYDKEGRPYGWGIARYTTPEALYGEELVLKALHERTPEASRRRIVDHLSKLLPHATPQQISRLIG